jgi:hypothetical protein
MKEPRRRTAPHPPARCSGWQLSRAPGATASVAIVAEDYLPRLCKHCWEGPTPCTSRFWFRSTSAIRHLPTPPLRLPPAGAVRLVNVLPFVPVLKAVGETNTGPSRAKSCLRRWLRVKKSPGASTRMLSAFHWDSGRANGLQDLRGFLGVHGTTRAGFQRIVGTVIVDSPAADTDIERLKRTVDLHYAVLDARQFRSNLTPCRCSQAKLIRA